MADITVAQPGLIQGTEDALGAYLKVFAGETLAAFTRSSVTNGRHIVRTISSGKSLSSQYLGVQMQLT